MNGYVAMDMICAHTCGVKCTPISASNTCHLLMSIH